jgi:hypothetical protein
MQNRRALLAGTILAGLAVPRPAAAQPVVSTERLVSTNASAGCMPAAAWTGSHYVVVWASRTRVWAATLDSVGTVVRSRELAVYPAVYTCPRIASAGARSLAVWHDNMAAVVGVRLDAATLSGAVFTIASVPGRQEAHPDVAFDSSFSSYLVAWQSSRPGISTDIRARRVHSTGALVGPEVVVSDARNAQLKPRVASRGGLSLVTWEDERDDFRMPPTMSRIYGQFLAGDASLLDGNFRVSDAESSFSHMNATVSYGGSQFLVAWHEGDPAGGGRMLASYVSELGEVATPSGFLVSDFAVNSSGEVAQSAYDAASNRFLLAWRPTPGGALPPTIRGTLIEAGTTTAAGFWISGPAHAYPTVVGVAAGDERRFLVTYGRDTLVPVAADYYVPYIYRRFVTIP